MNITKRITRNQLQKLLLSVSGAKPVTIVTQTEAKMNKTNNPYFGKVLKQTKANVFINTNYEASVNRALEKEGKDTTFVAKARVWGEKIPGTPLVMNNGKMYLSAQFLPQNKAESIYIFEDRQIPKEDIINWLPAVKENKNQGLDQEVIIRTYQLDNIISITMDKTDYIIK